LSGASKYEAALVDIQALFDKKNAQYGDSAFDESAEFPLFKWWMRLSDVRRKTARLERLTDLASRNDEEARKKLVSDYMDLANYAIIAVAVLGDYE
jgi:hypothetical protein